MFEAKLLDGSILKRIVEAIKDVVNDVNIDVSPSGKNQTIFDLALLIKIWFILLISLKIILHNLFTNYCESFGEILAQSQTKMTNMNWG